MLVCCRFIRYQTNLSLVSRGSSFASGMSRKYPPNLVNGIDRVLDVYKPTYEALILS